MANDNYATDDWVKSMFKDYYDPCPLNPNPEENGLLKSWGGQTYVNPPYSNPLPWVEKAIEESKQGKKIVLLLKVDTSTKWFAKLQEAGAHFLWINGRLKFGTGSPAPFPSMIAVLN